MRRDGIRPSWKSPRTTCRRIEPIPEHVQLARLRGAEQLGHEVGAAKIPREADLREAAPRGVPLRAFRRQSPRPVARRLRARVHPRQPGIRAPSPEPSFRYG